MLRWHRGDAGCEWLKGWKGELLYFPDYDPAGLRMFVTEVLPKAPSVRLLVPRDFEKVLEQRGKRDLYVRQERFLKVVEASEQQELSCLCLALRKSRKALEQESLLWWMVWGWLAGRSAVGSGWGRYRKRWQAGCEPCWGWAVPLESW